jgi:flagellar hook-basal body protein
MQRSLSSGVSGMVNHQVILDTVANNLANISTSGFKASTVSFSNALTQTSFAGSAPGSNVGGRNPNQIGLGVQTTSVNVDMRQGALQSTGRTFDLAVQGDGFFEVGKIDNTGNVIDQYFTRVGNFGLDSEDSLVDLSSGLKVVGKQTDRNGVTLGNLVPIDLTNNRAMDAAATENVTFQGNLSTKAGAFQGKTLTSAFPLFEVDASGRSKVATETSVLSTLAAFNTNTGLTPFTAPAAPNRTIYVMGTKPNGDAYAGEFTVNPWTDTVDTLMNKLNGVLTQGNDSFGLVRLNNGTLSAEGIGEGSGFSMFIGERDPINGTNAFIPAVSPIAGLAGTAASPSSTATSTITAAQAGAIDPTFTMPAVVTASPLTISVKVNGTAAGTITVPAGTYVGGEQFRLGSFVNTVAGDVVGYTFAGPAIPGAPGITFTTATHGLDDAVGVTYAGSGVARTAGSRTIQPGEAGLLQPSFTVPAGTYGGASGSLKIAIKVNGKEVGSIVPTGTLAAPTTLSLSSYPHVKAGDVVTYEFSGNKVIATPVTWTTNLVNDANSSNITADLDADGIPDMFQEGRSVDVNAWQYEKATNATLNWYRMRFAPQFVASSIQVYDKNGGSHILETRFLRTGTRSVTNGNNVDRYNGWDMMINLRPEDGKVVDDVVTGIQFDEQGRYLGSANLGSTVHGTALADSNIYVGTPIDDSIQVNWATTGTAILSMDLGQANSTTGLTGFGTASTGAAINQDGNANGELQTLSVQPNGNIVGLYSNGKSLPLYQIQIAVFSNPAGLTNTGGNLWKVSSNSGDPIIREPGTAGSGTLTPGVLEGSNVDIASEFTRLITAQRGFQVNARVIQTTDSILQELAGLIR